MDSRSRASSEQFAVLLEFMERYGDITRPQQGAQGRIRADRLWQELEELLNSSGGGVSKTAEKWKKVWADWKAKTKKKPLALHREASGTGDGPSSRQTLSAAEQRVLGIMGLTSVIGQVEIEERGFDEPQPQRCSPPPPTRESVHIEPHSQTVTDGVILGIIPTNSIVPPPSEVRLPPQLLPTQPPISATTPIEILLTTARDRTTAQRPRRRSQSPLPAVSPATSTPRRRRLLRARTREVQTPFERATSEFVAVENRRVELEEERERNTHQREMEKLRIEERRIEMEENRNSILYRLAGVLDRLTEILLQLRPSSLPSTDTL